MFNMLVPVRQLHFLANGNTELTILTLFWPVSCIKTGGHVVLLGGQQNGITKMCRQKFFCGEGICIAGNLVKCSKKSSGVPRC